jgi:1,4-dihydroxy-6-naphthoate synthase
MEPAVIALAYSVDADDAFMFHAIRRAEVTAPGLTFSHRRADTAELNRLALSGAADVIAISAGVYPSCADRYQLLPHGASVGRGFGPVVVARRPCHPSDLAGRRIGIPGLTTTAWMVLRMIQPDAIPVEIPIVPFARIFDAVATGEVDAALLIHEGRLIYQQRGLHLVVDIGIWWRDHIGLPLPLGVNVIRRALGATRIAQVSDLLRRSIRWAAGHRAELIAALSSEARGEPALADPALIDRYLSLYANADTIEMPEDARRGIEALFAQARLNGLMPAGGLGADGPAEIDWAP